MIEVSFEEHSEFHYEKEIIVRENFFTKKEIEEEKEKHQ
jgi:hypothetical protein